jgi:DNA-binding GntR family transcriptional regulator
MPRVSSDVAYDYIRKQILTGEYPMGHLLKTSVLSKKIGVSRTPIRDALRQLEADGVVEIEPHYGASVKTLDLNEFEQLCMMRQALETLLAGVAAENRTDLDVREIDDALAKMKKLSDQILAASNDNDLALIPDLLREDIRFHIAIMNAARKPVIKKELLRLHLINRVVTWERTAEQALGVVDRGVRDADCRRAYASHQEVYEAIRQGHAAAAREAMSRHVQDIIDSAQSRLGGMADKLKKPRRLTAEEQLYSV